MRVLFRGVGIIALAGSGFVWPSAALGATCTSTASAAWNVASTWTGCAGGNGTPANTPGTNDTVIIAGGNAVTVPAGVAVRASSLDVGNGGNGAATLTLSASTSSLTVSGAVSINAANNNSNVALNINAGTASLGSLAIDNSGKAVRTVQLNISTGTVTVTGDVTFPAANANVQIVFSGAGALNIGGDLPTAAITFTPSTGTVNYNGAGAQTIGAYAYNNLSVTKSAGTATLEGNTGVGGNLSVTCPAVCANGTLDLSTFTANRTAAGGAISVGAGATLRIGGTNSFPANYTTHTLNATSTVNYAGTNETVAAESYGTLILSGSGTKTMPGAAFSAATDFLIQGSVTATSGNTISVGRDFTISGTASFTAGSGLTVTRDVTLGAGTTFNAGSATHNVGQDFFNNGATFIAGTSTVALNGASAQVIGGTNATTFNNLTIANTAGGVSLGANETANGTLRLTSGVVNTTAAYTLISGGNCTTNLIRTAGWVAGNLQLAFPAGTPTCTFHIGDTATNYTPVTIAFTAATPAGNLAATVMNADHPNTTGGSDGIDATKDATRYWTLKNSTVVGTYTVTLNYVSTDIKAGSAQANFVVARGQNCSGAGALRTCSPWGLPASTNPSGTSTRATGNAIASGSPDFDFAVGEVANSNFARERQFIYVREVY
jgi:fibronectin-binding autotransporter adhesin